jgi:hypothetical protein
VPSRVRQLRVPLGNYSSSEVSDERAVRRRSPDTAGDRQDVDTRMTDYSLTQDAAAISRVISIIPQKPLIVKSRFTTFDITSMPISSRSFSSKTPF